ncbi:hypothetical protein BDN70DRAFT_995145 [Pholiota conissans]|uniref:Uncharacterized protein n=1 Tax=Pholiota conissans TaxID=109636 RepID=A0A9P5YWU7_9AGAR|nr:hypothetical protein BDN70DRAFT_995145 [Pholiota conissans]
MSIIILDDRDPSIQYTGSWNNGGNPDAEYQATVKWSGPAPGTFATLVFNGTGVTVIGSINFDTVQMSSYTIDGGPATTFTSTNATDTRYSQVFFTVAGGTLSPDRNHTLVMTPVQANLFIDFITVNVPPPQPSQISSVLPTPTPSACTIDQSQSQNGNQNTQSQSHIPLGPVIGTVVGGLGLFGLLISMAIYLRRQKVKMGRELPAAAGGDVNPPPPRINVRESQLRQRNSTVSPYDLSISTGRMAPISSSSTSPTSEQANEFNARKTGNQNLSPLRRPNVSDPPPGYQPT